MAVLGFLFILPYLPVMAGGYPYPGLITPMDWKNWQIAMLLITSLIPLIIAYFTLRGSMDRLPLVLVLILLAGFMAVYPLISLMQEEATRNAVESFIQAGMIFYIFILTLVIRLTHLVKNKEVQA